MTNLMQIIVQSNTLNFIIVLLIIVFLVVKFDVKSGIEKMRNEIKSYVDESSLEKENAQKELDKINDEIKHLPEEIADIKESAHRNIKGIEKKINNEIKDKMSDIENNATRILNLETKKFKSRLSGVLSRASIDLAKKNAIEQLNCNRVLHDKYIDESIAEIDRIIL